MCQLNESEFTSPRNRKENLTTCQNLRPETQWRAPKTRRMTGLRLARSASSSGCLQQPWSQHRPPANASKSPEIICCHNFLATSSRTSGAVQNSDGRANGGLSDGSYGHTRKCRMITALDMSNERCQLNDSMKE